MRYTRERMAWSNMIHHCHNPRNAAYPRYGGQGATVCDEWRESFEQFLADVGPKPNSKFVLFRHNKSLPYQPGNVSWEPRSRSHQNRECFTITVNGVTKTISQWSRETGIKSSVLRERLETKVSEEWILVKGDLRSVRPR